jgi:hypothetical protein
MHTFHTLQCKNNKLLLSNHHLLWCNIYTDKIFSDWNFRLPSLGFKCILVGLMNMIDGMQFWTPIFFYRHKTVLVMVKTLFLKYISCCCSASSLGNMPPATTHLKIFRPGQPYRLSACHLSMQHN